MFHKILAAIDLSDPDLGKKAATRAVELAKLGGGLVRLLNVQSLLPATFMEYVPVDFDAGQMERAKKALAALQADLEKETSTHPGLISAVARLGGTYPEILDEATQWGADLIVIGSHRPGMATFLLGSTAKTVVSHATCSVLVIRD